jgi:endonuclease YncB( thermonuclease family)
MTLQVRYCPQCGTRRTGYFRFCGRCGLDFDELTTRGPDEQPQPSLKPEPTTPIWPPPVQWPPPEAKPTTEVVSPAAAVVPPAAAVAPPVAALSGPATAAAPPRPVVEHPASEAAASTAVSSEAPALGWQTRSSSDYVQEPAQRPILARRLAPAGPSGTYVQPAPSVERRPVITFTRIAIVALAALLAVNAVSRAISQSGNTARTAAPTVVLSSPLVVESPCATPVSAAATPGPSFGPATETQFGTVTSVIDGDTIRVELSGTDVSVHYIGIDAPDPTSRDPAIKRAADAATATNATLVEGQDVYLERDASDKDQSNRLLRDVWLIDSGGAHVLVNHELVRLGLAKVDAADPNRRYADLLATAESSARSEKLGIWAAAAPTCQ